MGVSRINLLWSVEASVEPANKRITTTPLRGAGYAPRVRRPELRAARPLSWDRRI
jgi:hypothetical protein